MSEERFQKLKIVLDRFINILHEQYGFYLEADRGFELYSKEAKKHLHLPGLITAFSAPDDPSAVILNASTWEEMYLRNQRNGANIERTRRYVLVMIFEHWEADIRCEIAKAIGVENANDIRSDIMGDLNKIRNDILHSRGKVDQSTRNLIIKFNKGTEIVITHELFDKIFFEIFEYFNKLSVEQTGRAMYLDRSLNLRAKEIHRSMKHTVINPV